VGGEGEDLKGGAQGTYRLTSDEFKISQRRSEKGRENGGLGKGGDFKRRGRKDREKRRKSPRGRNTRFLALWKDSKRGKKGHRTPCEIIRRQMMRGALPVFTSWPLNRGEGLGKKEREEGQRGRKRRVRKVLDSVNYDGVSNYVLTCSCASIVERRRSLRREGK